MEAVVDLDFSHTVISETQLVLEQLPLEQSRVAADGRETQGNGGVWWKEKGTVGCLTHLLGPGNPCPRLVSQLCLLSSRTDPFSIS